MVVSVYVSVCVMYICVLCEWLFFNYLCVCLCVCVFVCF